MVFSGGNTDGTLKPRYFALMLRQVLANAFCAGIGELATF